MTPETKAAMKRLAGMTFELYIPWPYYCASSPDYLGIKEKGGCSCIGTINTLHARELGLTPGMTIAIYPVGHDEEK